MTIGIFTTTRADFGILIPLIKRIHESNSYDYKLFVGGTHLSLKHGYTIEEIRNNGFQIAGTFDYLSDSHTTKELVSETASIITLLSECFENESFDYVCVLGDRYELLPIVQISIMFRKPIIHIHGGEISQGAIDEQVRHMITKAAHIHFATCDEYAQNIKNMGEENWRVFNTGALAVENMKALKNSSDKRELFESVGLNPDRRTALMTYHPVTLESSISQKEQINNVFKALREFDVQILVTAPNVDEGGNDIKESIQDKVDDRDVFYVDSLGAKRYLSILSFVEFVIGNSSSGIIEVPFYKIPTINIGKRQQGRIRHKSVIDTDYSVEGIAKGIRVAMDPLFREKIFNMAYKFGNGKASIHMLNALDDVSNKSDIITKKLDFS